jgi:hypothetical protein
VLERTVEHRARAVAQRGPNRDVSWREKVIDSEAKLTKRGGEEDRLGRSML